jgi:hypothetical protein
MFSQLYNLYRFVRFTRNGSVKRRYYRWITNEKKKRLFNAGADKECLRLLCRTLANTRNKNAGKGY